LPALAQVRGTNRGRLARSGIMDFVRRRRSLRHELMMPQEHRDPPVSSVSRRTFVDLKEFYVPRNYM
jgi:hypothetical protein